MVLEILHAQVVVLANGQQEVLVPAHLALMDNMRMLVTQLVLPALQEPFQLDQQIAAQLAMLDSMRMVLTQLALLALQDPSQVVG
jgi:hypothetical protein